MPSTPIRCVCGQVQRDPQPDGSFVCDGCGAKVRVHRAPVHVRCTSCRTKIDVTGRRPGASGTCRCGARIRVPGKPRPVRTRPRQTTRQRLGLSRRVISEIFREVDLHGSGEVPALALAPTIDETEAGGSGRALAVLLAAALAATLVLVELGLLG